MHAEPPNLRLEAPLFKAALSLITRREADLEHVPNQRIIATLTGGAAVALYVSSRVSCDVEAITHPRIQFPDETVTYIDEEEEERLAYWDNNYNETLGPLHPDAERDALHVMYSPRGAFEIKVLRPVDLIITKLARFQDNDRRDIFNLSFDNLVDPVELEDRTIEALRDYIGNPKVVYENLVQVLKQYFHCEPARPEPDFNVEIAPQQPVQPEAAAIARNASTDMPKHRLDAGPVSGTVLYQSADRTAVFLATSNTPFLAVYRSDFTPMEAVSAGQQVRLVQQPDAAGPEQTPSTE